MVGGRASLMIGVIMGVVDAVVWRLLVELCYGWGTLVVRVMWCFPFVLTLFRFYLYCFGLLILTIVNVFLFCSAA